MNYRKIHTIYFSATGTTARIVTAIAEGTGIEERVTSELPDSSCQETIIPSTEIAVFGVPVFSGRVPGIAAKALEQIKGNGTPAIIACVYGNRDFDDALVELRDLVERNGFKVLSAGAFIAQHSIFPAVGHGRPDASDLAKAHEFGANSMKIAGKPFTDTPLEMKGNHPYRPVKAIPLVPGTGKSCNACGLCARQCPAQAIDTKNPRKTDKNRCIACARCIAICPQHAKQFGGLLYWLVSRKFTKNYSQRQEPYLVCR